MPNIRIKRVPEDVSRVLRERAARAGQSQQAYVLALLVDAACKPTVEEVFERIERRSGGGITTAFVVESIRADRDLR
ncbi:MAG TPA: hypothetical protein VE972_08920 [Conexibacter sp.]|nr:hypothetical protein [Conexibacter sp.]